MNILLVPLDERPCNYEFPKMILPPSADVTLTTLPRTLLGHKKEPGNLTGISDWIRAHIETCDAAVISLETLLFGGLLPSRVHYHRFEDLEQRLIELRDRIVEAKRTRRFTLFLYGLVMRTPSYSSADEEPDYYADFGEHLFRTAYLSHKETCTALSADEKQTLDHLRSSIPVTVKQDYEHRRDINRRILIRAGELFADGLADAFTIPQDDSAVYGYGARDRHLVMDAFRAHASGKRVLSYPGADEVGCSLVCLAAQSEQTAVRVWIETFDSRAARLVPKYESLPLIESAQLQIRACGALPARSVEQADVLLALNTGTDSGVEASDQSERDMTPFVSRIRDLSTTHSLPVIVADCAYPNGGDTSLVTEIDAQDLWDAVLSYAGWNTAGNSLGTALAQGVLGFRADDTAHTRANLIYRLCDDWAYQACVRPQLSPRDLTDPARVAQHINTVFERHIPCAAAYGYRVDTLYFPWNRLFEVGLGVSRSTHAAVGVSGR